MVVCDSNDLTYLIYTSTAALSFRQTELVQLLQRSRVKNGAHRITGLLLYRDRGFLQYLEGPPVHVAASFERIQADDRHTRVQQLAKGAVNGRLFPEWTMGFKNMAGLRAQNMPGYSECLQATAAHSGPEDPVQRMVELFYKTRT